MYVVYHSPVRRIAVVVASHPTVWLSANWQTKLVTAALLLISDREPLAWLLMTGRFAVPSTRGASVPPVGSTLFLYTTRGCYRNPGRDRGRIIGVANVTEGVEHLAESVEFRGRQFTEGFAVEIQGIAPYGEGVELAPLAGHLHALPDAATWSVRLRRSIVSLDEQDETTVRELLDMMLIPLDQAIEGYKNACRVPDPAQ
jgi:hypothetical protein